MRNQLLVYCKQIRKLKKTTMTKELRKAILESPICMCLCCGGLPVLGALKTLLFIIPTTLFFTICIFAISIGAVPYLMYYMLVNLWKTGIIGPNLKVLLTPVFFLVPFTFPFFGLILGLLASIGYAVFFFVDVLTRLVWKTHV